MNRPARACVSDTFSSPPVRFLRKSDSQLIDEKEKFWNSLQNGVMTMNDRTRVDKAEEESVKEDDRHALLSCGLPAPQESVAQSNPFQCHGNDRIGAVRIGKEGPLQKIHTSLANRLSDRGKSTPSANHVTAPTNAANATINQSNCSTPAAAPLPRQVTTAPAKTVDTPIH
jgi:hypothetical protein